MKSKEEIMEVIKLYTKLYNEDPSPVLMGCVHGLEWVLEEDKGDEA